MTSRTPTPWLPPLRVAIAAALALALTAPLQANEYTKEAKAAAKTATKSATKEAKSTVESSMKEKAGMSVAADRTFLDQAIKGSEKEVAATLLARERASDAKVRELASNLQRDHLNLLSRLDETAVALGVREQRTYNVASSSSSSPEESATSTDTGIAGIDKTASGGYVDDMTASGSATLGGATITAPGTTPAMGGAKDETAALATPGVTAAKQDPSVQALSREAGEPFDRAFLDALISSHEKSVADFTKASKDMSLSAQSRSLAEQSLPTLRDHLEMSRSLRASLATN